MARALTHFVCVGLLGVLLVGCGDKAPSESIVLALPKHPEQVHITDQTHVAGIDLVLWNHHGGCQLQLGKGKPPVWLKPMAPCHFIKSPGRDQVQVFRLDKTTQIVAVVGTPTQQWRCGQEVQGLVINGSHVKPSTYLMQGSVHCADQGLQNFQYSLFANP